MPAIEVVAPAPAAKPVPRTRGRNAPRTAATTRNVRRVFVYPTAPTPVAGVGINVDKVPASINAVGAAQIARTDSLNIADALQQHVPGLIVSDTTGNPFMPDVQFRGFVASPVAGTSQGLAVYQNGMRINEAFGDTVNWDLVPTAAIRSVTVVTNNPAFGLNALGGAVNVQMKNGFNYHGAEINTMGGSFGRIQSSAQYGKQIDNFSVYGALEGLRENGFRNFSESAIRRFYGDVGYRTDSSEFHLNVGVANNNFGAAATVPVELLQNYWGATYTTPQTTNNKVAYVNLTGKVEATPTWTIDGSVRVRAFRQKTVDGNPTETERCDADPALLCFNSDTAPANGLNGVQLANPFPDTAVLGQIDRTSTRSTTTGATLQATNTDQLFGHNNQFMVGTSFDSGVTRFGASAELGTIGSNYVVSGSGLFLGPSGDPISIGPVSLRATNRYTGIYALDTFDVTDAFSISGGGRFNYANIVLQDQIGTDLNGNHTFSRFNPMIGGTYKITPGLTAYAGYSEANRAPTPLELACADPARPCIAAAFLIADPPLKQVVSRTVEAGFRGTSELDYRNARMEGRRVPRNQCRRHPRDPESGAAGIWLFPERRSNTPPGHRGPGQSDIEGAATLRQLCTRRCTLPRFVECSARTARSPMPTAISRWCRAIEFQRYPVIGSSSEWITGSPMRSRWGETPCSSAISILSEMTPIRHRSCRRMPSSI